MHNHDWDLLFNRPKTELEVKVLKKVKPLGTERCLEEIRPSLLNLASLPGPEWDALRTLFNFTLGKTVVSIISIPGLPWQSSS